LNDLDGCVGAFERALTLNPNDPAILVLYGQQLTYIGKAPDGIQMIDRAYRLNPHYPAWYDLQVDPFYATRDYGEVIKRLHRFGGELGAWARVVLILSYAQSGRTKDAEPAIAALARAYPEFSMERLFSDLGGIAHEPTLALYLEGARKAGLHECATQAEVTKDSNMTRLSLCDVRRASDQRATTPG
jgi:adenylate cyclase